MNNVNYKDQLMYVKWWLKPDIDRERRLQVLAAIKQFTAQIERDEPGTLTYLVYLPDMRQANQPPVSGEEILYVESYANKLAFESHLKNFNKHIGDPYKDCFLAAPNNSELSFIQVLECQRHGTTLDSPPAGYIRNNFAVARDVQWVNWWTKSAADKAAVLEGLANFADWCYHNEPQTLIYLFATPIADESTAPPNAGNIVFLAAYVDDQARDFHYDNWDEQIIGKYKDSFVTSADDPDTPYIEVENVNLLCGFERWNN
ncbi:MAG: quinol monooxygenase YgiN [Phenylobacterium sp.]|jgi:quinol monooxygenase YgiN